MDKVDSSLMADLYAGLAFGFDFPSESHLRKSEENLLLVALARASRGKTTLKRWFPLFFQLVSQYEGDEDSLTRMRREYQRLFEPPSPLASPYESQYVDSGKRPGEVALQLLGTYKNAGFRPSPDLQDLPDHICVELEFASRLLLEMDKRENTKERLLDFMRVHLKKWVPRFLHLVSENAGEAYYLKLAVFARELISGTEGMLR